jgi:probable HAF family extracellular repeat protein
MKYPKLILAGEITLRLSTFRLAIVVVAWHISHVPTHAAHRFVGLGHLSSGHFSEAKDVSSDGSAVVGQSGRYGFHWTQQGGMVDLGAFGGAEGISSDGTTIVGQDNSLAYRWTVATGIVSLGDLSGGSHNSVARDVTANGSVVVGRAASALGHEAFRWTQTGGLLGLGDLPGGSFRSDAYGVSGDGSVIVGAGSSSSSSSYDEAFRWTQSTGMVGLGDLPGGLFNSLALDVSNDGSVIVGWSNSSSGPEAFRWTQESGMVGLGDMPGGGFFSKANGVSANGSIIVGVCRTSAGDDAFVWDESHGMRVLRDILVNEYGLGAELAGWKLQEATAVSADGTSIVGYGWNPIGQMEAWIARLDPLTPGHGDFDGDGDVDGRDFLLWQRGQSPNPLSVAELADWQMNYGVGGTASSNVSLIPEPSSIWLAGLGVACVSLNNRRFGGRTPNCHAFTSRANPRPALAHVSCLMFNHG